MRKIWQWLLQLFKRETWKPVSLVPKQRLVWRDYRNAVLIHDWKRPHWLPLAWKMLRHKRGYFLAREGYTNLSGPCPSIAGALRTGRKNIFLSIVFLVLIISAFGFCGCASPPRSVAQTQNVVFDDGTVIVKGFNSVGYLCFVAENKNGNGVAISCR